MRSLALRAEPRGALPRHPDELAVEEPLEIRVAGEPLAVTMRTPGHDHELVAGFLLAEGLIRSRADLGGIHTARGPAREGAHNTMDVLPAPGTVLGLEATRRGTLTTSACGMCGRKLIDDLLERLRRAAAFGALQPCFHRRALDRARASISQASSARAGLHAAGHRARPARPVRRA